MAVHKVTWAPAAIEQALAELIEMREGRLTVEYLTACNPPMTLMCAIDCLRAILSEDADEFDRLRRVEAAARAYVDSDPPRPEWQELVAALDDPAPERRVVLVEGVATTDGRLIRPGAITWPPGPLPLVKEPDGVNAYIGALQAGHLVDVRREGSLITARVVLDGDPFPDFDWVPSADLDHVRFDNEASWAHSDGPLVFTAGELRGAHVLRRVDWCWTAEQIAEAAGA